MESQRQIRKVYMPFVFVDHYRAWKSVNCKRCTKSRDEHGTLEYPCFLEQSVDRSFHFNAPIYQSTALRIGYLDRNGDIVNTFVWECRQVEWTQEWKDKIKAKMLGY